VVTLVNRARATAGCAALATNSGLARSAVAHSADMATRDYFSHTTPEGVTADQRITRAGYHWSTMGENIAYGQPTADAVMQAWMASSGHRANILNCAFHDIGVGLAYSSGGTPYWTQDFAAPAR
jgi:uncharacterized protein YkwD